MLKPIRYVVILSANWFTSFKIQDLIPLNQTTPLLVTPGCTAPHPFVASQIGLQLGPQFKHVHTRMLIETNMTNNCCNMETIVFANQCPNILIKMLLKFAEKCAHVHCEFLVYVGGIIE